MLLPCSELSIEILCCDRVWSTRPHSVADKDGDDNKIQFRKGDGGLEEGLLQGGGEIHAAVTLIAWRSFGSNGCNFWHLSKKKYHGLTSKAKEEEEEEKACGAVGYL